MNTEEKESNLENNTSSHQQAAILRAIFTMFSFWKIWVPITSAVLLIVFWILLNK